MATEKQFLRSLTMEKPQRSAMKRLERRLSFQGIEKPRFLRIEEREEEMGVTDERKKKKKKNKNKGPAQKRGDSPLHLACRSGDLLQVREILFNGEQSGNLRGLISGQNIEGETPIYVAAETGQVELVRELLKHSDVQSASIKAKNGFDAFHIAVKEDHVDVLTELMSSLPESAMTVGPSNVTALDTAANQGHIDVVNLLLETNASLAKITRNNGKTVLHVAARQGHVEVVRALLAKEPGLNFRSDRKGQAAIHMAVKGQNVDVVTELVRPDPSVVNLEDNKGNSALHIATSKGRSAMVESLLKVEGVNVNACNKQGETALDISAKKRSEDITSLLRRAGAVAASDRAAPASPAKQLTQTVSEIKHDVHTQLQQTHRTGVHVNRIKKRLKKLHTAGLNNAINSSTVVAVLIATIAFAAIFTLPGQYVEEPTPGYRLGDAYIATSAPFVVFFVADSLALFISLAVVVAQTSIVVVEHEAKKRMVSIINKRSWWLTLVTTAMGTIIMFATLGSMCYCIVYQKMEQGNKRKLRRSFGGSQSRSLSGFDSDSDVHNSSMYVL
ncbi:ankyrin repeat-containing protein At5g02620-like isoform X2 [Wolffia australiana]